MLTILLSISFNLYHLHISPPSALHRACDLSHLTPHKHDYGTDKQIAHPSYNDTSFDCTVFTLIVNSAFCTQVCIFLPFLFYIIHHICVCFCVSNSRGKHYSIHRQMEDKAQYCMVSIMFLTHFLECGLNLQQIRFYFHKFCFMYNHALYYFFVGLL